MKLFATEPVLTIGGLAAALVAVLAIFGVVVDTKLVETLLLAAIPLGAAVWARFHVTPTSKVPKHVSTEITGGSIHTHLGKTEVGRTKKG